MGKPISIKWKLTILFVVCGLGFVGWIFTDGAHRWVVQQLDSGFKDAPIEEQRDSPWAWRWLAWANFRGSVCGEFRQGCSMYKEFCGLPADYNALAWDWMVNNPNWGKKFSKKCTPDGKSGWGPMHPMAPDAYYEYICLMEPNESGVKTGREAAGYFMLFYTWHRKHSADHKPHPAFGKYWNKIRQKIINSHIMVGEIPEWDYNAKLAVPYKEES